MNYPKNKCLNVPKVGDIHWDLSLISFPNARATMAMAMAKEMAKPNPFSGNISSKKNPLSEMSKINGASHLSVEAVQTGL